MKDWKQKLVSAATALLGALLMLDGLGKQTTWTELPGLFTPLATIGLIIIVWRAFAGQGQMTLPNIKKPGKK